MTEKQKQIESILFTHKAAMLSKVIWKNADENEKHEMLETLEQGLKK